MWHLLRLAAAAGELRPLDLWFARRMCHLAGNEDPALVLAAALTSQRVGQGDVCLDLAEYAGSPLFPEHREIGLTAPDFASWCASLRDAAVVGAPGDLAPLILDDRGRCYLGRYWRLEHDLATSLIARCTRPAEGLDLERLRSGLDRLFPQTQDRDGAQPDWQRLAAALAVLKRFCVISGGPGTGKTRTVTAILALLLEQAAGRPVRIGLAAPTGKAAARLVESVRKARTELALSLEVAQALPESASTLHRLLRFRPERAEPHFRADNPLPLDLLVVDEASMVDLPLMARLLAALPTQARLILLGDKDQLASVEAGMVLGDICGRGQALGFSDDLRRLLERVTGERLPTGKGAESPLGEHIVVLRRSYRFGPGSGIQALASAVNAGDGDRAIEVLDQGGFPDLQRIDPDARRLPALIRDLVVPAFRAYLQCDDPAGALAAFTRIRIFCAVREGPFGVNRLNRLVAEGLEAEGLIESGNSEMYVGRPVMVTENDYDLRLFNGDVGLLLRDPEANGQLRAFFEAEDGPRRVLPTRLPRHETVYAMTVHKSQGSEFDNVLLVLPETDCPVLTRELLYTGITRARETVTLVGSRERIAQAARARVSRSSGLFDTLWEPGRP